MVERTPYEVVIIGAGFAGASTAAALTAAGVTRVLVVEAEAIPGHHASGRNAAMARRPIADPVMAQLATESVAGIRRRWPGVIGDEGGLLLGTASDIERLAAAAGEVPELRPDVERLNRAALQARWPVLDGATAEAGLFSRGCGIADIHSLLRAYIDDARQGGATFRFGVRVEGIEREAGRASGVRLSDGTRVACGQLINAAGYAVNRVAALAGVTPIEAAPFRRHLFVTARLDDVVPAGSPFVWDVSHGYYFRPEGDGVLMCACDQTEWLPHWPDEPSTDPTVRELLAERFSEHVPGLNTARPKQGWAGLRVLTPDDRFVIGPDPELDGFFWVAALGGHGMTTSLAVGRFAAASLIQRGADATFAAAFRVSRLRQQRHSAVAAQSAS